MAISKIYGNQAQYEQFIDWLSKARPDAIKYTNTRLKDTTWIGNVAIALFPEKIDFWLLDNCPFEFITARIVEQYDGCI